MTHLSGLIPLRAILIGCLLLGFSLTASAGKPEGVTEAEMALLPRYCPDTQTFKYGDAYTNTSPNAPKWVGMMGKGFWAMHHYCWALINLGRAQKPSTPANVRQAARESAVSDMQYVIENTTPDFILLPEIYSKQGEVLLSLKRPQVASLAFGKARLLKPDYWPPYFHWGEYLLQTGQKKEAREVVEEGLSYAPQTKALRSLLVELGGDPSAVQPRSASEKPTNPAN